MCAAIGSLLVILTLVLVEQGLSVEVRLACDSLHRGHWGQPDSLLGKSAGYQAVQPEFDF